MAKAVYKPGVMNKTEAAYALTLEIQRRAGLVKSFLFESVRLKIGHDCWYTPDFLVITAADEIECHEVKGFWRDDARVKIKAASERYAFRFIAVMRDKNSPIGWDYEEIK